MNTYCLIPSTSKLVNNYLNWDVIYVLRLNELYFKICSSKFLQGPKGFALRFYKFLLREAQKHRSLSTIIPKSFTAFLLLIRQPMTFYRNALSEVNIILDIPLLAFKQLFLKDSKMIKVFFLVLL